MSAAKQRRSAGSGKAGHKQFLLRLPNELLDKIERFSQAGYRSKTAEVVMRLQASFEGQSIDEHGVIVEQRSRFAK